MRTQLRETTSGMTSPCSLPAAISAATVSGTRTTRNNAGSTWRQPARSRWMNGLASATTTSEPGKLGIDRRFAVRAGGNPFGSGQLEELGSAHPEQRRSLALGEKSSPVGGGHKGAEFGDRHLYGDGPALIIQKHLRMDRQHRGRVPRETLQVKGRSGRGRPLGGADIVSGQHWGRRSEPHPAIAVITHPYSASVIPGALSARLPPGPQHANHRRRFAGIRCGGISHVRKRPGPAELQPSRSNGSPYRT
jgi:hypothetical protein